MGSHPADITPCPSRVGVLEQMIRGYADKLGEHVVEPALGLTLEKINKDQAGNDASKTIDMFAEILPPVLFTPRIRFASGQTLQSLTIFILKNTNAYNTKYIYYETTFHNESNNIDLAL